ATPSTEAHMSYYKDQRMKYQLTSDVSASGRGAVHAAMRKAVAATGQTPWPHYALCGSRSDITMVKTEREVTCKQCLKKLPPEEVDTAQPLVKSPSFYPAYAYSPRQGAMTIARTHAALTDSFQQGRFRREQGDALCKPRNRFWGLEPTEDYREVDCPTCVNRVRRYGIKKESE